MIGLGGLSLGVWRCKDGDRPFPAFLGTDRYADIGLMVRAA